MRSVVNLNSEVYYKGTYWNDYPRVGAYMAKNFTGDEKKWWTQDFKERYAKKPFEHALFLNCGDGRFERQFIDEKIVKKATAFDISPNLVKKAKDAKGRLSIKYFVADANKIDFNENEFDLVVNNAALHHTQFINRICRILAKAIKSEGYLVNFDYIGPHRNQYPLLQWLIAHKINNTLPYFFKQDLHYPHIPTMLVTDPTEAIHSELILETVERYFYIMERHDTGGGIAYLILTHNPKINRLPAKRANKYINQVLKLDEKYTKLSLVPPLFSYFIARPNKEALKDKEMMKKHQIGEDRREWLADKRRGVYFFIDYLKLVKNSRSLRDRVSLMKKYLFFSVKNHLTHNWLGYDIFVNIKNKKSK